MDSGTGCIIYLFTRSKKISKKCIEESRSFISGCLRGMFANLFGKTSWLSAIQSANAKYVYHIKIIYHDGSASGCRVDIDIFEHFAVHYAIA